MRSFVLLGFWSILLVAAYNSSRCSRHSDEIDTVHSPIVSTVNKIKIAHPYYQKKVAQKTDLIYAANSYKKIWLNKRGPDKNYQTFSKEVREAANYGINPDDYLIDELDREIKALYKNRKRTETEVANLDIKITASFFLFTTHLLEGRIRYPGARDYIWKRGQPHEDDVSLLLNIKSASDLRREIEKLHPEDMQYKKLQHAFTKYEGLEIADTFPSLPSKIVIKPNESNENIPLVRRKIQLTDMKRDVDKEDSLLYDEALVNAIIHFQKRHGLEPDGIIKSETIKWLNTPLSKRADIIMLNLERLRWSPQPVYDNDEIIINVPEYVLRIYDNKKEKFSMRVVLGSEFNATPVFTDTLKYIVFSPTWNVPKSIIGEEMIPNLEKNPAYYSNGNFVFYKDGVEIDPQEESWSEALPEVDKYSIIQNPGASNALGNVKFVMPNNFNIYLHDTPADQLFQRKDRALSHGCIRLEKPAEFAAYLLRDNEKWNKERITEAMKAEEPKTVNLKRDYAVHVVYRTAWVDDEGIVNFREDIYGHDERHLAQMQKPLDISMLKK